MKAPRKKRASRAKVPPPASSPLISSPAKSSPAKSSPLKPNKAPEKSPSLAASDVADHIMEDFQTFDNEQSSTLLSRGDHLDTDTSANNGEQSSAAQASPSAFAGDLDGMRARTASELPSLPLSNPPLSEAFVKQLRQLFPGGSLVPSMARTQDIDTYPVAYRGIEFSLFECSVICAIRMFVQNNDGSRADDDTAAEVLKAMRDTTATINCKGLYEHIILKGSSGHDWQMQVYNDLQNRRSLWAGTAQLYWKGWIAYMDNICRCHKRADRLGELTGVLPIEDEEPLKTMYESGQPLSFLKQKSAPKRRQTNQGRFPTQTQSSNQWANKSAILNPIQMQSPYEGSNQTTWPMATQTPMLIPYPWEHQVGMPGPASVQLQSQVAKQAGLPVAAELPVRGTSQSLYQHQLQIQKRAQMQTRLDLQNQGYMPQMQGVYTDAPPLILSNPELQMPAPTRPAEESDIAGVATQMLTPFVTYTPMLASQIQTPMLASQPLVAQRRLSYYQDPQE